MKALIAAGGYGVRLLPITKSIPKAMLPLAGKPLIQHVVEEIVSAGVKEIGILIRKAQRSIVEHFQTSVSLAHHLHSNRLNSALMVAQNIDRLANVTYLYCDELSSLGDSILMAASFLEDAPFLLAFADEVGGAAAASAALLKSFATYQCTVVCCETRNPYFLPDVSERITATSVELGGCRMLPAGTMIGRYLCHPELMRALEANSKRASANFYAALDTLARRERLLAIPFESPWWNCNDPIQYLQAILDHTLCNEVLKRQVLHYIGEHHGSPCNTPTPPGKP